MKFYGNTLSLNYGSPNCVLISTTLNEIKDSVIRWEKNRPSDPTRISEIAELMKSHKADYLDGLIYAWENDNILLIYDGWTRLSSALSITNFNPKILLVINYSKNEKDIRFHFNNLNKSVPIPLLYIDDIDLVEKRKLLEDVTTEFCRSHKSFVSTARKPRKGNFCRDTFFDILSKIIDSDDLIKKKPEYYIEKLNQLNKKLILEFASVKNSLPKKVTEKSLYIFCLEDCILEKRLQETLVNLIEL
jgi:hypothetical protein